MSILFGILEFANMSSTIYMKSIKPNGPEFPLVVKCWSPVVFGFFFCVLCQSNEADIDMVVYLPSIYQNVWMSL